MSKDQMFAKVVLASKPTNGAPPIITIHARYPRIIHGEIMTHRVFSRNARSSRAVPVATMLKEIREAPFVPWHWGKNQKGMQADQVFEPSDTVDLRRAWLTARDNAVDSAEDMMDFGVHKQIANRLIEPFSFIDTLITSTSWANFFHLRDHKAAEPHFQDLAGMFREAINGAEYQTLDYDQWHLPYVNESEINELKQDLHSKNPLLDPLHPVIATEVETIAKKLSVARCARISYTPFDGDASIERELERYDLLVGSSPLHASPAEHQATPRRPGDYKTPAGGGNLGRGWIQYRKTLPGEYVEDAA